MLPEILLESPIRKEAFYRLKVFLSNPGKFSLLVIGGRGVGKHFTIQQAFAQAYEEIKYEEEIVNSLCLNKLNFIDSLNFPSSNQDLDQLLQDHANETLVVEDIENLSEAQQKIIIKAMSTVDGNFGISEKINIRFVFSSSVEVASLRQDGELLLGSFWDRISQLVVEIPGFKDEKEFMSLYFKATWEKMKFEDIGAYRSYATLPVQDRLMSFLESYCDKFDGCFRDLDKLAIMFINYRIVHYQQGERINEASEKVIISKVKADFVGKNQLKSIGVLSTSTFQIREGFSMEELYGQFRTQVRNWGTARYGSVGRAEEKLSLKPGTMKNYKEGKATKKERQNQKNQTGKNEENSSTS
jgi:hypothetical protein